MGEKSARDQRYEIGEEFDPMGEHIQTIAELHKRAELSSSFLARTTKKTPDCLVGHAILNGNLMEGFVMFTDTAHQVGPFFRWDSIVRHSWTWMLLGGDNRGKTAKHLLEYEEALIELPMRSNKVN